MTTSPDRMMYRASPGSPGSKIRLPARQNRLRLSPTMARRLRSSSGEKSGTPRSICTRLCDIRRLSCRRLERLRQIADLAADLGPGAWTILNGTRDVVRGVAKGARTVLLAGAAADCPDF